MIENNIPDVNEKDELFAKGIKEIQNEYLVNIQEDANSQSLENLVNPDWKAEWENFIKYDRDYSWEFLFDLILYKLEKMRLYFSTYGSNDDIKKTVAELSDAIDLGKHIKSFDYNQYSDQFYQEHIIPYMVIYKANHDLDIKPLADKLDQIKDADELLRIELPRDDSPHYHAAMPEVKKYCEEHNLQLKDIIKGFVAEWDKAENQTEWKRLEAQAERARQADLNYFFIFIATRLRGWWD